MSLKCTFLKRGQYLSSLVRWQMGLVPTPIGSFELGDSSLKHLLVFSVSAGMVRITLPTRPGLHAMKVIVEPADPRCAAHFTIRSISASVRSEWSVSSLW